MTRVLILGDTAGTGFGTVTRDLASAMVRRGDDVRIVSMNEDAGYHPKPSRCRGCHAEILWAFSPKGSRTPLDRDGINHFITCPDRDRFRHKKGGAG